MKTFLLIALLASHLASLAQNTQPPAKSEITISGTKFLLDGKPFLYTGVSFFNAIYNRLRRCLPPEHTYQQDGSLRANHPATLKAIQIASSITHPAQTSRQNPLPQTLGNGRPRNRIPPQKNSNTRRR